MKHITVQHLTCLGFQGKCYIYQGLFIGRYYFQILKFFLSKMLIFNGSAAFAPVSGLAQGVGAVLVYFQYKAFLAYFISK